MSTSLYSATSYAYPAARSAQPDAAPALIGGSPAMQRLRTQLQRLGPHLRTALVRGEAGTGKYLVARTLHLAGSGADAPFVVFNPTRVNDAVIEWEGDASTLPTATGDVDQLLKAAHGGTVYFDEISEMPEPMQQQLLLALRRLDRVRTGFGSLDQLTCRVIASTSCDLRVLAATGRFRSDLYQRMAMLEIALTPLRERREDIPQLAQHFAAQYAAIYGVEAIKVTPGAMERLQQCTWRGNVRELETVIRHAIPECSSGTLEEHHLSLPHEDSEQETGPAKVHSVRLQDVVEQHVFQVLQECGGNKVRAAELLGISRSTLYRMIDACSGREFRL